MAQECANYLMIDAAQMCDDPFGDPSAACPIKISNVYNEEYFPSANLNDGNVDTVAAAGEAYYGDKAYIQIDLGIERDVRGLWAVVSSYWSNYLNDAYIVVSDTPWCRDGREPGCNWGRAWRRTSGSVVANGMMSGAFNAFNKRGRYLGIHMSDYMSGMMPVSELQVLICPLETPCNAGFTGPDDNCIACVAGKYKSITGSSDCIGCYVGQFSTIVGATYNVCQNCASNSDSFEHSDAATGCACNAGWVGPDTGQCVMCEAGKYKTEAGSVLCTDCRAGQYSVVVAATSDRCMYCPHYSSSPPASGNLEVCTCNAGAQGPDAGPCALCVAGKYKINSGNALCADCLPNQYSEAVGATSNVCQTCSANSQSPAGSGAQTSCKCNAGAQGFDGGSCSLCIAGKYKISSGDALCTECLANQYSTAVGAAANVCQTCAANSQSPAGSGVQTSCICNAGAQGPDAGPCTLCIAGTYKIGSGNALCTNCLANQYSAAVSAVENVCQTCTTNSQSLVASEEQTSCICNAGWSGINGEVCTICAAGKYKTDVGSASCTACATGKFSVVTGSDEDVCTCNAGSTGADGPGTCTSCEFGKYKSVAGSTECTGCAAGKFSAVTGSISNECTCNAGTTGPNGVETCTSCEFGKYKSVAGSTECTGCAAGKFSAVTGSISNECTCNAGKTGPNGVETCTSCDVGKYKTAAGSAPCTVCASGKFLQ